MCVTTTVANMSSGICGDFVRKGPSGKFLAVHQETQMCNTLAGKKAMLAETTQVAAALQGLRDSVSGINARGE